MGCEKLGYGLLVAVPWGVVRVDLWDERVAGVDWVGDAQPPPQGAVPSSLTGLARRVGEEFAAYFADPGYAMDLPLVEQGTAFQRRVWGLLRTIQPGAVLTYGEAAQRLGSGARAVGNACRANPLPIIVPCHRIVARVGIGGFAGATRGVPISTKRWLLHHEGVVR